MRDSSGEAGLGGPSDEDLVRAYLGGDQDAFRLIVRRHGPWLLGLLRGLLPGAEEDALDALQELLCGLAAGGLRRFRGQASLRTFLYRCALRRAADAGRSRRAAERKRDRVAALAVGEAVPAADEILADAEKARAVRRALLMLTPADRAILRLREFEGATLAGIASAMGISEGAAKLRLHRARKRFAALWAEEGGG